MSRQEDDLISDMSRLNLPDLYPRRDDPFRPGPGGVPMNAPGPSTSQGYGAQQDDILSGWLTNPAMRPVVYQTAMNFQLTVGVNPVPLANQTFACDGFVVDVLSTAANSVFFGYGSGVSLTSGLEIRVGIPLTVTADNSREQWELQRLLEVMTAILAAQNGVAPMGAFMAPRVVFNANNYYLVAAAATVVSVMLFNIPQYQ